MAPDLYNLQEVNKEALNTLGWGSAENLLKDPNAPSPPRPADMLQMAQAKALAIDSQSKMMTAQAKVAETQMKMQTEGQGQDPQAFEQKQTELALKQAEIEQRRQDVTLDAINRKRDRESRERLATLRLAEDMAKNPEGLAIADKLIKPDMLDRLESNEPALQPSPDGEIK